MMLTLVPVNFISVKAEEATKTTATVHVKPDAGSNWTKVYGKLGGGENWISLTNYKFMQEGVGGLISANEKNEGWYSFKVTLSKPFDVTHIQFNAGGWTAKINQYDITTDAITAHTMELWLQPTEAGTGKALESIAKPDGWAEVEKIKAPINPASLIEYKSPVVNEDNSVLIQYKKKDSDTFTKLYPIRMCRKTPCFSYGDIRHVHQIYASN